MASNNTPRGRIQDRLSPIPERHQPATVELLAERFGLTAAELASYGVRDLAGGGGVGITYRDEDGAELLVRRRTHIKATNATFNPKDVKVQPYGLDRLQLAREAGRVFLCEGESDCWCGWHCGLPFLGIPGATNWACLKAPHLTGIDTVYIIRESDNAGGTFVAGVAAHLRRIGCRARLFPVAMPEGYKDPGEIFCNARGQFVGLLGKQVAAAVELLPLPATLPLPAESNGQLPADPAVSLPADRQPEGEPHATQQLVELVRAAGVELFHDESGRAYASCREGNVVDVLPVRGRDFGYYLHHLWRVNANRPLGKGVRETVVDELEALACTDGPERAVHVRRAVDSGLTYRDLGGPGSAAVRIGPGRWEIVKDPPVPFIRPNGQLPLPTPDPAGRLAELRSFLHLDDEEQWMLLVGWLLTAARGVGPFPVLIVTGQAGSGKSLMADFLKELLDPAVPAKRVEPKRTHDVFIGAGRCELLVYENLSRVEMWLSDALCVVATGGDHATRTLHSNDEEFTLRASNPILITAIEDVATRSDLLSRSVLIDLPPFGSGMRRNEEQLRSEWRSARPRLLGGLFNTLAGALAELPTVDYDRDARMVHMAQLGAAAGPVLGWPEGAYTAALQANRQLAAEAALEAQPIADAVCLLLDKRPSGEWVGTAAELGEQLRQLVGSDVAGSPGWPKLPHHLAGRLKNLAPDLLTRGIVFQRWREGKDRRRVIRLSRAPGGPITPSDTPW